MALRLRSALWREFFSLVFFVVIHPYKMMACVVERIDGHGVPENPAPHQPPLQWGGAGYGMENEVDISYSVA